MILLAGVLIWSSNPEKGRLVLGEILNMNSIFCFGFTDVMNTGYYELKIKQRKNSFFAIFDRTKAGKRI